MRYDINRHWAIYNDKASWMKADKNTKRLIDVCVKRLS